MKKTLLVTLAIVAILGGSLSYQTVYAKGDQKSNNVTDNNSTAEHEWEKGEKHLKKEMKKLRKRVLNQISPYMEVDKPCGLPKEEFVKILKDIKYDYNGVFARNAELIWKLEQEYQVNGIFVSGVAAWESLWCSSDNSKATNNFTSQMTEPGSANASCITNECGSLIFYESEEACFRSTFKNLRENYLEKEGKYYNGNTISAVNVRFCPGPNEWSNKVAECMKMIFE